MINIDDSPELPHRSLGLPGVSIASDFMPLVNSTRSRMLELNVEYRDSMIHLKVWSHISFNGRCSCDYVNSGSWSWNHHNSKDSAAREDRSAALPAGAQVGYCDDNDDDSWWCHQGMEVERPLPCHRQEDAAGAEPAQGELSLPPDSWDSSHPPKWGGQVSS